MQDAYSVCAFPSGWARSSVLGVRPSALIRYRVPGARYPGPGTRYQAPAQFLTVGGPVLGLPMEVAYQRSFERLRPGDLLVLYTDGIPETRNPAGEEFGVQRLVEVVRGHRTEPVADILERVFVAVGVFRDSLSQEDDQTLILIRKGGSLRRAETPLFDARGWNMPIVDRGIVSD